MLEPNTIYNMDLFQGIATLDENSVDMALTSPPYFDARDYGGETPFEQAMNWENWCLDVLTALSLVVKPNGVIWWNTGSGYANHSKMVNVYSLVARAAREAGIFIIDEFPWIKMSGPPKKIRNRPHPMWEHNYIFSVDPENVVYYRDNVRIPYAQSTLKRMQYRLGSLSADAEGEYKDTGKRVTPNAKGANPPNYLPFAQDTTKRPHPAPMNPQVANWAILAYTQEGDVVLDPMMGAGTTAVEALKLGRQYIGFELVEEYVALANLSISRYNRGDDPYRGLKDEWEAQQEQG